MSNGPELGRHMHPGICASRRHHVQQSDSADAEAGEQPAQFDGGSKLAALLEGATP
jgi:hypothetical protein